MIDSTGRSYTLDPSTLPSARGQGEPITGKITPPPGATVQQVLMEADDTQLLMASDAGYGFICTFADLQSRTKSGKALLTLPDQSKVMTPQIIDPNNDQLLVITEAGRMLMFSVKDLPQLSKGKGNKIISIPSADFTAGKDKLLWLLLLNEQNSVTLYVGKRKLKLRSEELQKFKAERGRKGTLLPRGLQRIDRVDIE